MEDHSFLHQPKPSPLGRTDLFSTGDRKTLHGPNEIPAPFHFQLTADFDVVIRSDKDFLTPLHMDTLRTIATSSATMKAMARMAMQLELAQSNDCSLQVHFSSPSSEAIIACLTSCLSDDQWQRWEALKDLPCDQFSDALFELLFAFHVTLQTASCSEVIASQ